MDGRVMGESFLRSRPASGREGSSLLEVMVAMAITLTVMMAILGMFGHAYRLYAMNKRLTVATNLAYSKLTEFKAMTVGDIKAEDPKDETRTLEGILYTLDWEVSDIDVDGDSAPDMVGDLVKVNLDVNWDYRGSTHRVSMATLTSGKPM